MVCVVSDSFVPLNPIQIPFQVIAHLTMRCIFENCTSIEPDGPMIAMEDVTGEPLDGLPDGEGRDLCQILSRQV